MARTAKQNSGLLGPFALTADGIAENVEPLSIGAFAVGRLSDGKFFVRKTGRDDRDLAGALRDLDGVYDAFKFRTIGVRYLSIQAPVTFLGHTP